MKRQDILMTVQAKISLEKNSRKVGRTYRVLIEEESEDGCYIGRADFQAPEVDGVVFVYEEDLKTGAYYDVTITDAFEYDLAGEIEWTA
jgi:ribosomal protein S12 methylthiotransferase